MEADHIGAELSNALAIFREAILTDDPDLEAFAVSEVGSVFGRELAAIHSRPLLSLN